MDNILQSKYEVKSQHYIHYRVYNKKNTLQMSKEWLNELRAEQAKIWNIHYFFFTYLVAQILPKPLTGSWPDFGPDLIH